MSKKRILFVSYTAEMVGPSFSLLQLLEILKEQYAVSVMLPQSGPFVEFLNIAEIDTVIEDRHNGLGALSFNLGVEFLNWLSGRPYLETRPVPEDPAQFVIQRSDQHNLCRSELHRKTVHHAH